MEGGPRLRRCLCVQCLYVKEPDPQTGESTAGRWVSEQTYELHNDGPRTRPIPGFSSEALSAKRWTGFVEPYSAANHGACTSRSDLPEGESQVSVPANTLSVGAEMDSAHLTQRIDTCLRSLRASLKDYLRFLLQKQKIPRGAPEFKHDQFEDYWPIYNMVLEMTQQQRNHDAKSARKNGRDANEDEPDEEDAQPDVTVDEGATNAAKATDASTVKVMDGDQKMDKKSAKDSNHGVQNEAPSDGEEIAVERPVENADKGRLVLENQELWTKMGPVLTDFIIDHKHYGLVKEWADYKTVAELQKWEEEDRVIEGLLWGADTPENDRGWWRKQFEARLPVESERQLLWEIFSENQFETTGGDDGDNNIKFFSPLAVKQELDLPKRPATESLKASPSKKPRLSQGYQATT